MRSSNTLWPPHFSPEVVPRAPTSDALSSICIGLEAWRRGLTVTFNSGNLNLYTVSDGDRKVHFNCSLPTSVTSREDAMRLRRKWVTNEILESNGLRVPQSIMFNILETSEEEVRSYVDRIGYPLVVKPNTGSVGRGVFIDLRTWGEVQDSLKLLEKMEANDVIMQSHHDGEDLRVLVIGNQVIGAARRLPANVIGGGVHTVGELIQAKNRMRRRNPFLSKGAIRMDHEVERCLREQRLKVESIPASEEHVYLRKVANASAGGDVVDVTEELPEDIKSAAVKAVSVMPNIVIAGVDILHDAPRGDYVIIEMNRRPHIGLNMYPTSGVGADVPRAFVDFFFPDSRRREGDGDLLLRFDPSPIRSLLLSRASDAVSVSPLPDHRFPFRRNYSFDGAKSGALITRAQELEVLTAAASRKISGRLRRRNDRIELIAAGLRESSVQKLVGVVAAILGVGVTDTRTWRGVVTQGFFVEQSLVGMSRVK